MYLVVRRERAASLDGLYILLTAVCGVSFVLVIGAMVYFMYAYKYRSPKDKTSPITHNGRLEFLWSAIPAIFLMVFFVWGEVDFVKLSSPPADAIDIRVTGEKWKWTIEYPGRSMASTTVAGPRRQSPAAQTPSTPVEVAARRPRRSCSTPVASYRLASMPSPTAQITVVAESSTDSVPGILSR